MKAGIATSLLVLLADQLSKAWILYGLHLPDKIMVTICPVLNFAMVWNHGVTFGMLSGNSRTTAFALGAVALLIVIFLFNWMRRAPNRWTQIALGAIAGGAIGNVIDRLRYGAVVDFIQAHWGVWSWYVFNVADAAICCGVVALLLEGLFPARTTPATTPESS